MPRKAPEAGSAWFAHADDDLVAARLLLAHDGPPSITAVHIQQAIEKTLKGFLLSRGWSLRKIHNLVVLLNDAVELDAGLETYRDLCEAATGFYAFERYPDSPPSRLEPDELQAFLAEAETMVSDLRAR